MKRRNKKTVDDENGFAEWGGYMNLKKSKLMNQFDGETHTACSEEKKIFSGVSIFVNGFTSPSSDELKNLMMKYGGVYHYYYDSNKTTHVIATNLPNCKIKLTNNMKIVNPNWIVDSIKANKLLDYRQYLLFKDRINQPKLMFKERNNSLNSIKTELSISSNKHSWNVLEENKSSTNIETYLPKNKSILPSAENSTNKRINSTKINFTSTKTANDENFLTEYYSKSRLHHIATIGSYFKDYVAKKRLDKKNKDFLEIDSLRNWLINHKSGTSSQTILNYEDDDDELNDRVISGCVVEMKAPTVIMHIDMDCFFVSVGIRNRPDLKGLPVAVAHAKVKSYQNHNVRDESSFKKEKELYENKLKSNILSVNDSESCSSFKMQNNRFNCIPETDSMSEIASCSYEARRLGVKNGMFLGEALKLCPNLVTIPYDFDNYKEVSFLLYDIVSEFTVNIEAVSCDEMYVDCTDILKDVKCTPMEFATYLRGKIKEKTGCPCSTGFGSNKLQARLATKFAKPDGQYFVEEKHAFKFMKNIKVNDLPGVGRAIHNILSKMDVKTCEDLQKKSLSTLRKQLGNKTGDTLFNYCRGLNSSTLNYDYQHKSISLDVNYGIRFENEVQAQTFLHKLSSHIYDRLKEVEMKTQCVTLKLKIKAKDAPEESAKFLGHGMCDNLSKSSMFLAPTSDLQNITREIISIYKRLKINPKDLRGIGISLTHLCKSDKNRKLDEYLKNSNDTHKTVTKMKISNKDEEGFLQKPLENDSVEKSKPLNYNNNGLLTNKIKVLKRDLPKVYVNSNIRCKDDKKTDGNSKLFIENNDLTLDQIRELIRNLVTCVDNPDVKNTDLIISHIVAFVFKRRLDEVQIILNTLFWSIKNKEKNESWSKAYSRLIVEGVQEAMIHVYNAKLKINNINLG